MSPRLLRALSAKLAGGTVEPGKEEENPQVAKAHDPPTLDVRQGLKTEPLVKNDPRLVAAIPFNVKEVNKNVFGTRTAQYRSKALYMANQAARTPDRYENLQDIFGTAMPIQIPMTYQKLPSLDDIYRGFTGEADYAGYHPIIEAAAKMGSAQALRDCGLLR